MASISVLLLVILVYKSLPQISELLIIDNFEAYCFREPSSNIFIHKSTF